MTTKILKSILVILIMTAVISIALHAEDLHLASWNIRILSDNSRTDEELEQIAMIIDRYDLVAVQEVRDTRVLDRLIRILPDGWRYTASEPAGRGVKELYAFLYREDSASLISEATLIDDPYDLFIREPASASFAAGEFDFTLVTVHILFGDSKADRREEIRLLDDVMELIDSSNGSEEDVILMGDFNMSSNDHGWQMDNYTPLILPSEKTTITDTSSYDNIWLPTGETYHGEYLGGYEIYRFDEIMFSDDDQARLACSDHRPISAYFSTSSDDDAAGIMTSSVSFRPSGMEDSEVQLDSAEIRIASVTVAPTDQESITLYNPNTRAISLHGWHLGDKNDPESLQFEYISIPANTNLVLSHEDLNFQINNSGEILYLRDHANELIDIWRD